jgi:hypothetical protein
MTNAIEFAEAVLVFKRACQQEGLTPILVGVANGRQIQHLGAICDELMLHPEVDARPLDVVGGVSIHGVEFKRAWK